MNDQTKKLALIEHIKRLQEYGSSEILLPYAQYFDGNGEDRCNLCCNNIRPVSAAQMVERLRDLAKHPDFLSVWVRFCEYEDALEDSDCWIGSDSIYVVTRASAALVREWFSELEATEVWETHDALEFAGLPPIPDGYRLIAVWWD